MIIEINDYDSPFDIAGKLIFAESEVRNPFTGRVSERRTFEVEELKETADYIYTYVSHREPPEEEE